MTTLFLQHNFNKEFFVRPLFVLIVLFIVSVIYIVKWPSDKKTQPMYISLVVWVCLFLVCVHCFILWKQGNMATDKFIEWGYGYYANAFVVIHVYVFLITTLFGGVYYKTWKVKVPWINRIIRHNRSVIKSAWPTIYNTPSLMKAYMGHVFGFFLSLSVPFLLGVPDLTKVPMDVPLSTIGKIGFIVFAAITSGMTIGNKLTRKKGTTVRKYKRKSTTTTPK